MHALINLACSFSAWYCFIHNYEIKFVLLAIADAVAMICIVTFYWRVVITLRQSVAKDSERSQQESEGTIRKRLLQRAFGLISISYFVFYLPLTVAFPVRAYFQQTFKQTPVPVGEQINYERLIGCIGYVFLIKSLRTFELK